MMRQHNKSTPAHNRNAFTLVEMLVSVTLILLMMTLFASIFSMATETVSRTRVIANNDQKVRLLTTLLRNDIANRTVKYVYPYRPGEDTPNSITSKTQKRDGYLYLSLNDLYSGSDDLLQFTASVPSAASRYQGLGRMLYDQMSANGSARAVALHMDPNQPDFDDGRVQPNNVAESTAAEIAYFLRNGNLYRRLLLIREPRTIGGSVLQPQPVSNVSGNPFFFPIAGGATAQRNFAYVANPQKISIDPASSDYFQLASGSSAPASWGITQSDDFWSHFDFAASPEFTTGSPPFNPFNVQFHSTADLDNSSTADPVASTIGKPYFRFGFDRATGLSREHDQFLSAVGPMTPHRYIGRFLHGETSRATFNWPLDSSTYPNGTALGNGNPMDIIGTPLTLNDATGFVEEFVPVGSFPGGRHMEDLVMANVHEFRIEIWDDRLQNFAPLGYGNPVATASEVSAGKVGDFHLSRRINTTFGPRAGGTSVRPDRVFDTWHPVNMALAPSPFAWSAADSGATLASKQPPFIAYRFYPPRQSPNPMGQRGPSPDTMPEPFGSVEAYSGLINRGYWEPNTAYLPNQIVFPRWIDTNGDGLYQPTEVDSPGLDIVFRCVQVLGPPGPAPAIIPWPQSPGVRFTLNSVEWESIDNRRPLRAIRITIRFFNENSNQIKEIPLVFSLLDGTI